MIRILLADDHRVVREGVRALLERNGFAVVAEASDGFDATRLARSVPHDISLIDLTMPRMNGLDCTRAIRAHVPGARVIILTMHEDKDKIGAILRAGARGHVCKSQASEELCTAIQEVASGGTYLSPRAAGVLFDAYVNGGTAGDDDLTLRERQVLQLVAEGCSTKEIASALGVTGTTAESYRSRLMSKLNIHDTATLVRYAIRNGVTSLSLSMSLDATTLAGFLECFA